MSASLNSQHSTLNWPSPSPRLHPRMWHRHPADEYMGWKPMPLFKDWPNWEVVSSYSSATAPDSHGISCADPLFQARKERSNGILPMITGSKPVPRLGTCARRVKIYLINQTV